jgi:DtxR family Mn-dependent transcriptional regulator
MAELPTNSLADLEPGESGQVVGISPILQGPQRRRLLDLGVVPGTEIRAEFASSTGDPVAYLIRGALIALRSDQASLIQLVTEPEAGDLGVNQLEGAEA